MSPMKKLIDNIGSCNRLGKARWKRRHCWVRLLSENDELYFLLRLASDSTKTSFNCLPSFEWSDFIWSCLLVVVVPSLLTISSLFHSFKASLKLRRLLKRLSFSFPCFQERSGAASLSTPFLLNYSSLSKIPWNSIKQNQHPNQLEDQAKSNRSWFNPIHSFSKLKACWLEFATKPIYGTEAKAQVQPSSLHLLLMPYHLYMIDTFRFLLSFVGR